MFAVIIIIYDTELQYSYYFLVWQYFFFSLIFLTLCLCHVSHTCVPCFTNLYSGWPTVLFSVSNHSCLWCPLNIPSPGLLSTQPSRPSDTNRTVYYQVPQNIFISSDSRPDGTLNIKCFVAFTKIDAKDNVKIVLCKYSTKLRPWPLNNRPDSS